MEEKCVRIIFKKKKLFGKVFIIKEAKLWYKYDNYHTRGYTDVS